MGKWKQWFGFEDHPGAKEKPTINWDEVRLDVEYVGYITPTRTDEKFLADAQAYKDAWSDIWTDFNKEKAVTPKKAAKATKVEVEFNRALTMAEREHMRSVIRDADTELKWHGGPHSPGGDRVTIETDVDSRAVVSDVAEFVASDFLNVFPTAAKTLRPKVRV